MSFRDTFKFGYNDEEDPSASPHEDSSLDFLGQSVPLQTLPASTVQIPLLTWAASDTTCTVLTSSATTPRPSTHTATSTAPASEDLGLSNAQLARLAMEVASLVRGQSGGPSGSSASAPPTLSPQGQASLRPRFATPHTGFGYAGMPPPMYYPPGYNPVGYFYPPEWGQYQYPAHG